jgi:hypothetical protein
MTALGQAEPLMPDVDAEEAAPRGRCSHSALSFSVPLGILHISENGVRQMMARPSSRPRVRRRPHPACPTSLAVPRAPDGRHHSPRKGWIFPLKLPVAPRTPAGRRFRRLRGRPPPPQGAGSGQTAGREI